MLHDRRIRALDVIAGTGAIHTRDGRLVLDGTEPVLGPDGVTMTDGAYAINDVAMGGIADKLGIPLANPWRPDAGNLAQACTAPWQPVQTTTGIRQTGSATSRIPYSVAPGDLRLPVVVVRLAERLRDVIDEIAAAPDDGWAPRVVDEELRAVDAIIDLAASGLSVGALSVVLA